MFASYVSFFRMMNESLQDAPKRNWPLIWVATAVGLLIALTIVTSIALYIANFNLLEWIE